MLDLDAYVERIAYTGPVEPTRTALDGIVAAHVEAIPFENLDVLLGRTIDLSPEALHRKLVLDGRGGYCFEQNGLLLAVLAEIGFDVHPLSGRVRYPQPRSYLPTRTHLFVRVDLDGERLLADVGVGGLSMTAAIRLDTSEEQATPHEPRRIQIDGPVLHNQVRFGDEWHDVYEFTGETMPPIDRTVANWYTSAHPQSHFRSRLVVARALPDGGRLSLLNDSLTRRARDGSSTDRTLTGAADLMDVLAGEFGLTFPAGTEITCPALPWSQPE